MSQVPQSLARKMAVTCWCPQVLWPLWPHEVIRHHPVQKDLPSSPNPPSTLHGAQVAAPGRSGPSCPSLFQWLASSAAHAQHFASIQPHHCTVQSSICSGTAQGHKPSVPILHPATTQQCCPCPSFSVQCQEHSAPLLHPMTSTQCTCSAPWLVSAALLCCCLSCCPSPPRFLWSLLVPLILAHNQDVAEHPSPVPWQVCGWCHWSPQARP